MPEQQAAILKLSARFDLAATFLRHASSVLGSSFCALLLSVPGAHAGTSGVPAVADGSGDISRPEASARAGPIGRTDLSHPSAAQSEEMRSRIELTRSIVQNVAADAAGKGANEAWRVGLSSVLYATPSTTLREIAATASTLDQAHAMARADLPHGGVRGVGANSLGSTSDSLVFTPITPCRFIDTRNVGGGITTPRQFDTSLDASTYGGTTGCKLPAGGEASIAANVTIVVAGTASGGFLGIRPVGSTAVTSFINWPAGGTQGWANAGIVSTARNGSGNYAFEAFASSAGPDLIVDYFGYFSAASSPGPLNCISLKKTFVTSSIGPNVELDSDYCPSSYTAVSAYCELGSTNDALIGTGTGIDASTNRSYGICREKNSSSVGGVVGVLCCSLPF